MRYFRILVRSKTEAEWFFMNAVFDTLYEAKAHAEKYVEDREYRILGHEAIVYNDPPTR